MNQQEKDDHAFEGIVASLLRNSDHEENFVEDELPELTVEEEAALDSLPSNFVEQIVRGHLEHQEKPNEIESFDSSFLEQEAESATTLEFALNKGEVVDNTTKAKLDEAEREIIRRKRAEAEESESQAAEGD